MGSQIQLRMMIVLGVVICMIAGCSFNPGGKCDKAKDLELEVMSFNIRYGSANDGDNSWAKRKQMVFDTITKYHPVVLGVQEALDFQVQELIAALPEYDYVGVGRDDGKTRGEYAAILYLKDQVSVEDSGTFWLSETPEVPGSKSWNTACTRICTWANFVDKQTSQRFDVYNIHFDHVSQQARLESVKLIVKRTGLMSSELPSILMGDFNAAEDNPAITLLTSPLDAQGKAKPYMLDTFRVLNPDVKDVRTAHGFKGKVTGGKIDYVFINSNVNVKVIESAILRDNIDDRYPSDHYPVRAKLIIKK